MNNLPLITLAIDTIREQGNVLVDPDDLGVLPVRCVLAEREGGAQGHGGEREEGGVGRKGIPKRAKHDKVYRNGARLILQYNPNTEAFNHG